MPIRLDELQRRVVVSLYGEAADLEGEIRADGGISAADRLAIYRGNLHATFAKALELGFPVLAALCGAEFFTVLAREFQRAHPSVSGDLQHVGAPLPQYLRQRYAGSEYAYFADVAALEWAREESARAAEAAPPDLQALGAIAADAAPGLRLPLQPGVRLVASRWPVFTIWQAHQGPGEVQPVNLDAGAEHVLAWRARGVQQLECLPPAEHRLLEALQDGATLGDAFDAALATDPAFDIAAALQRCAARGILAGAQAAIGSGVGRAIA